MARYIKEGISEDASFAADTKVKEIVEGILNDIRTRGDDAVRDLSIRFDNWNPESFQLSAQQIEDTSKCRHCGKDICRVVEPENE